MADTIKSSESLKVVFDFYDGDDRTVSLDNPKIGLTATEIKAVGTLAKNTQPIIGDKGSAAVVGISSAKIVGKTTRQLDLN